MTTKNRVPGYEGCPGCVAVDVDGKPCAPGNLAHCTAIQGEQSGWVPGSCVGCHVIANGGACVSGNAKRCAVAWFRNR